MNLELLETTERQIPDRIDATLTLPVSLHFQKKKSGKNGSDNDSWKSANCVAYNWRGTYAAVGYESGTVAIFDVISRTICALYRKNEHIEEGSSPSGAETPPPHGPQSVGNGVSLLSWSKRSRSLLAGTPGQAKVRLIDTTHPYGVEECGMIEKKDDKDKDSVKGDEDEGLSPTADSSERKRKRPVSSLTSQEPRILHHRLPRSVPSRQLKMIDAITVKPGKRKNHHSHLPAALSLEKRYPELSFAFPHPIGSTLQLHPKDACAGIATLNDGSLVAFWVPISSWEDKKVVPPPQVKIATIHKNDESHISCASFDPDGDKIYAATCSGKLLGFEVSTVFEELAADAEMMSKITPGFVINVPGGASILHIVVSRNGTSLILNSVDAAIRMYSTRDCWTTPEDSEKPLWCFQDNAAKVVFSACDFSGDGKIVLGGVNAPDKKYELYIWDVTAGHLIDKLTGASVEIHSVAWHPTRSFLATAAADGLVDVWGPRVNWTAFAPDFQALTENTEYVEREDEFDIVENGENATKITKLTQDESAQVNILAIDPVPAFASDSESEEDVFYFETKVKRIFGLYTS